MQLDYSFTYVQVNSRMPDEEVGRDFYELTVDIRLEIAGFLISASFTFEQPFKEMPHERYGCVVVKEPAHLEWWDWIVADFPAWWPHRQVQQEEIPF